MNKRGKTQSEFPISRRSYTSSGQTVTIKIFQQPDTPREWVLEVFHDSGLSTVWLRPFSSQKNAYAEFLRVIAEDGIEAFATPQEAAR